MTSASSPGGPDPTKPDSTNPDLTNPDPANPGPANPGPTSTGPTNTAADAATPDEPPTMPSAWEQMGGLGGMLDSALPVIVFVIVNAAANLTAAIIAAIVAALVVAGFRLSRKEPIGQALGGLFGVAIAAFIASKTGTAKGFFLFGIWSFVAYGAALLVSILVRWPLIGVIWENLNGRGNGWRSDRRLVRKYDLATGLWVLMCAARFVVQRWLYDSDQVGWLAFARIAMGYPLFILVIVGTVLIITAGSGQTLRERWTAFQQQRKDQPKKKALTFRERYEIAKQQQEAKERQREQQRETGSGPDPVS